MQVFFFKADFSTDKKLIFSNVSMETLCFKHDEDIFSLEMGK